MCFVFPVINSTLRGYWLTWWLKYLWFRTCFEPIILEPGKFSFLYKKKKKASRPSCHLLQHQEAWTAKLSSWKSVKQTKITSHEVIRPPVRFSDREQPRAQLPLNTLLFTPSQAKDWLCKSSLHPARVRGDLPAMDADKPHLNMKEVQSQGTTLGNFFTMN